MDARQTKLNADYQDVLNMVYGGTITARGKYLNPHAVIQHHCKNCMKNFYARPLWLVNKRQIHECLFLPKKDLEKSEKNISKNV